MQSQPALRRQQRRLLSGARKDSHGSMWRHRAKQSNGKSNKSHQMISDLNRIWRGCQSRPMQYRRQSFQMVMLCYSGRGLPSSSGHSASVMLNKPRCAHREQATVRRSSLPACSTRLPQLERQLTWHPQPDCSSAARLRPLMAAAAARSIWQRRSRLAQRAQSARTPRAYLRPAFLACPPTYWHQKRSPAAAPLSRVQLAWASHPSRSAK